MLGGMRAVAYNDAVQTIVLIAGSATLTDLRPVEAGRLERQAGRAAHVRLRHVQPLEAAHSRRRRGHLGAGAGKDAPAVSEAWYFNGNFPWLGMAICARSSACGTGARTSTSCSGPWARPNEQTARRGSIFAAFLKLFPVYLFIIPGLICFALAKSGKVPELAERGRADGKPVPTQAQAAFPLMVKHLLPPACGGSSWPGCSRP